MKRVYKLDKCIGSIKIPDREVKDLDGDIRRVHAGEYPIISQTRQSLTFLVSKITPSGLSPKITFLERKILKTNLDKKRSGERLTLNSYKTLNYEEPN